MIWDRVASSITIFDLSVTAVILLEHITWQVSMLPHLIFSSFNPMKQIKSAVLRQGCTAVKIPQPVWNRQASVNQKCEAVLNFISGLKW